MSNLTSSTRELWNKSVFREVYMRNALLNRIIRRRQMHFRAGTKYKITLDKAELVEDPFEELASTTNDLYQEYGDNDTLQSSDKTIYTTAEWSRRRVQIPLTIQGGDVLDNEGGGDGQIFPLRKRLVKKGHRGMRLYLQKAMYRAGATARDGNAKSGFQGIGDALTHDITYGTLSRATTATNAWWQGSSADNTYADWDTAISPTLNNFRVMVDSVSYYVENPPLDLICVTSNTIYRAFQSQAEAARTYRQGPMAKWGFTSMMIDDIEMIKEPYLDRHATRQKYFYLLHLPDWHLMLDRRRKLGHFTGFTWQGNMINGQDKYLGRVLLAGNMICTQPNANIFRSNMS